MEMKCAICHKTQGKRDHLVTLNGWKEGEAREWARRRHLFGCGEIDRRPGWANLAVRVCKDCYNNNKRVVR